MPSSTWPASLRLPPSRVYGVATFYSYFTLEPPGVHTCVVCMGTACYINGATKLLDGIVEELGVSAGQTTSDGQISVLTAHCVGACSVAPVVVIDGEVHGKLSADIRRPGGAPPVTDHPDRAERLERLHGRRSRHARRDPARRRARQRQRVRGGGLPLARLRRHRRHADRRTSSNAGSPTSRCAASGASGCAPADRSSTSPSTAACSKRVTSASVDAVVDALRGGTGGS